MATRATPTMLAFAAEWDGLYPSAVFSGIVGDPAHALRGGYHMSIIDNPAGNYSITRKDDAAPPGTWPRDCASAVDMNLNLTDMKRCHARLVGVWRNRANDPRAKYINGHNGWDGNDGPGRYDWVTGAVSSADDGHKWHVHLEWKRRYVNDPAASKAILSILKGETVAQFLGGDMPLDTNDLVKIWSHDIKNGDGVDPAYVVLNRSADNATAARAEVAAVRTELAKLGAQVATMAGKDMTDEPSIVAGVLAGLTPDKLAAAIAQAGLTPEAIAAAVPDEVGQDVIDALVARLQA